MSQTSGQPSAAFSAERLLPFSPQRVFAAFARPDYLARWWGPDGFRSTFERCEFVPGGRWVFVMHGPNGIDYPTESVFREIVPGARIVIDHVSQPRYTITVSLTAHDGGTRLTWAQEFERALVAERLRSIVGPANEQNLDRLQSLLAGESAGEPPSPDQA